MTVDNIKEEKTKSQYGDKLNNTTSKINFSKLLKIF